MRCLILLLPLTPELQNLVRFLCQNETHDNSSLRISDPKFAAVPTYPVVLPFKLDDNDVNLFVERVKPPAIPGLPPLNPNKMVCVYHQCQMHIFTLR